MPGGAPAQVRTALLQVDGSPVSSQAERALLLPAQTCSGLAQTPYEHSLGHILSPLRKAGCSCSHGGSCRAIGVGDNPLFQVFLAAVCLQGVHLHPSLLLLALGKLQATLPVFAFFQSPGDAQPVPGSSLDGAALGDVNLWLNSIFTLLYPEGCGILDQSWAGKRLFFAFTVLWCSKLLKTGISGLARNGNRRDLPARFQVASHAGFMLENRGRNVSSSFASTGDTCVALAAGGGEVAGTVSATTRSSQRDVCLCPGGRRPGGKKHERWDENQPEEQGPWAKSATSANVINGRSGSGAGATLSKHGRGRWMLSQKQCCKRTQNQEREILFFCFKNKNSDKIFRKWCQLSPAPAPRASRVSLCFGDRDMDVVLGMAVQVPRE